MIKCILEDLREPFSYIPQGILLGITGLVLWKGLCFIASAGAPAAGDKTGNRNLRMGRWRGPALFLSVVYVTVMVQFAFLSRPPGSRTGVSMRLFGTWGKTDQSKAYVIENVIMFLPFGFLLPVSIPFLMPCRRCVLAGFVCSAGLELLQWRTERGHCQLDDVVMNVLGTALGWVLLRGARHIYKKFGRNRAKV